MKSQNRTNGYSRKDAKKVELLLSTLLPHLIKNKFIFVGGISTRYNATKVGLKFLKRPLNDIDIIIENKEVILPTITRDFLIYHYHPRPCYNGSFYIALIFPNTKTKIDFFDYSNKPEIVHRIKFEAHLVQIQSAEDQLVNTIHQIQRISPQDKVDPRQISDLKLLMKVSNIKVAEKIWEKKHYERYKMSLDETIERSLKIAKEHPDWLQVKPRRKNEPYICRDCANTKDFPITPMEIIYKLMGYIK